MSALEPVTARRYGARPMEAGYGLAPAILFSPGLAIACGAIALVGAALFCICVVLGAMFVPGHDWIADTISDLGAGRSEYIADIGIYGLSAALAALAVGAGHVHLGRGGWSAGALGLALLSLAVFLVGARDEYGDGDSESVAIHIYLVYTLGLAFALVPWALSGGAGAMGRGWRAGLRWLGVIWALAAPVFFFVPTGYDGLYERGLGLIALAIVATIALLLIARGRRGRWS